MSTVGIVVVSHSARLAEAARELAEQMVPSGSVPIRLAAGAGIHSDGAPILGTDATRVAGAIDELAGSCDGVLVLMDLGSAVMSAEFALELRTSDVPVRLASAPFVEGLLAAVVTAAQGASLPEVAAEANGALIAKSAQLGEEPASAATPAVDAPDLDAPNLVRIVTVRNPPGLHARPASMIVRAARGSEVTLRRVPGGEPVPDGERVPDSERVPDGEPVPDGERVPGGEPVPAASMMRLLGLGASQGDEIELAGDPAAVQRVAALFDDGFGEMS